jgi:hypothetical protein
VLSLLRFWIAWSSFSRSKAPASPCVPITRDVQVLWV